MGWTQHNVPEAEIFQSLLQSFRAGHDAVASVKIPMKYFTTALYSLCAGACGSTTEYDAQEHRKGDGQEAGGPSFLEEWVSATRQKPSKAPKSCHKRKCYKAIPKSGILMSKGFGCPRSPGAAGSSSKTGMLEEHGQERKGVKLGLLQGWDSTWSLILLLLLL